MKPDTARYYREVYNAQIGRRFGRLAPTALTFSAVAEANAKLKDKPTAANRMISTLRAMLSWAEDQRLIRFKDGNPSARPSPYRERARQRFLSVPEIRAFHHRPAAHTMDAATRRALMLELLLAPRGAEVTSMRKSDVDLTAATWTIPAPVMKSNKTPRRAVAAVVTSHHLRSDRRSQRRLGVSLAHR